MLEEYLKEEARKHVKTVHAIKAHEEPLRLAKELGPLFAKHIEIWPTNVHQRHYYAALDSGIFGPPEYAYLELHLSKYCSLKTAPVEILEIMLDNKDYSLSGGQAAEEHGFVGWFFTLNKKLKMGSGTIQPRLLIKAYYRHSMYCNSVGTGEFTEKKKLVCL